MDVANDLASARGEDPDVFAEGVDRVVASEALDDDARRALRRCLDVDDATWTTSRGWALFIAMITFPYYGAVDARALRRPAGDGKGGDPGRLTLDPVRALAVRMPID